MRVLRWGLGERKRYFFYNMYTRDKKYIVYFRIIQTHTHTYQKDIFHVYTPLSIDERY